jgi:hypothetical protein
MSKELVPISLSPQAWKVETDNFFLALNRDDPNKDFPQAIYDCLSVSGRAPNASLSLAFVNRVKGIRDGTMEIPNVEKKGISQMNKGGILSTGVGEKNPILKSADSPTNSTITSGLNKSNTNGLLEQKHVSPEDAKEEETKPGLNSRRKLDYPPMDNGALYNGPWNKEYLKKDFVVKNMKELESCPFVQETGSQAAEEAYNLTTEHWKMVNEHFPMAHLHGVAVALHHSHVNVLEQMARLERNNEGLQSDNAYLLRMVQSLMTHLDELENKNSTTTTQSKKRPHWG